MAARFRRVTLIIDAAPLVALGDRRDPQHEIIHDVLRRERGVLVVPAPVCAETCTDGGDHASNCRGAFGAVACGCEVAGKSTGWCLGKHDGCMRPGTP